MGLKIVVDTLDGIEEAYHGLYTEQDGKYVLTGVEGLKSQADIDRLSSALAKERNDHKSTKTRYAALGDRPIEEVLAILDKVPELEAAAAGKLDETKLNELVETRIKTRLAPVEREKQTLTQKLQELSGVVEQYTAKERQRAVHDAVRAAAVSSKVLPEALEDALLLAERVFEVGEDGHVTAKDGVGCTPGIDPAVWLSELQGKRPHWWPASQGGGSAGNRGGGSGVTNPFSADGWNMTEQGRLVRENRGRAEQLAKAAGTSIGGARPVKRA